MPQATDPQPRTVAEIVYGCIVTLVLCLSYCVRPNISSPSTSTSHVLTRKLRIMFWMVIAPELIISWAVEQWMEGNKVARQFTARGWNPSHGQILAMGGFLLYKEGQPFQVVSPEMFTTLLDASCIEFPFAPREEIGGKTMAHPLFAALTFLQALWFIIQCIARRIQGFAITQIEMITLSLVIMNGLVLLFWWHKPLDPRTFVRIDLIRPLPPPNPNPQDDARDAIKLDFVREQSLGRQVKTIFKMEALFLIKNRRNPFLRTVYWFRSPLNLLEGIFNEYGTLFFRLDKHLISEGSTEVNIFYAPDTIENLGGFLFVLENTLGSLFAAAHISMWYNYFPTYRDMMVWRIASLFCVALPMVFVIAPSLLAALYIVSVLLTIRFAGLVLQAMEIIITTGILLGLMGMLVARLALIVEGFICLKSVGGTTLQTVSWIKYIPHFA